MGYQEPATVLTLLWWAVFYVTLPRPEFPAIQPNANLGVAVKVDVIKVPNQRL